MPQNPPNCSTLPQSAAEESCEKQILKPPGTRYSTNDFGISCRAESTRPCFSARARYFLVIGESVALSVSKMPIMSRQRIFLLFPTCKYINYSFLWYVPLLTSTVFFVRTSSPSHEVIITCRSVISPSKNARLPASSSDNTSSKRNTGYSISQ